MFFVVVVVVVVLRQNTATLWQRTHKLAQAAKKNDFSLIDVFGKERTHICFRDSLGTSICTLII